MSDTRLGRLTSAKLDASLGAPEPHDFAVRFTAVRLRALRSLTGSTPALRSPRARGHCRVHRIPFPTSVTIAKRPSVGQDGFGYAADLGQRRREIFLQSHIDEALVYSRGCQPLILVALHGAAMTARRAARDLPVLTPARHRFPRAGELHWVTLGVQSDRRKPERCSEDVL